MQSTQYGELFSFVDFSYFLFAFTLNGKIALINVVTVVVVTDNTNWHGLIVPLLK